jgi:hypothetical protein
MCNPWVPIPFGAEVSFDLPPASHWRLCAAPWQPSLGGCKNGFSVVEINWVGEGGRTVAPLYRAATMGWSVVLRPSPCAMHTSAWKGDSANLAKDSSAIHRRLLASWRRTYPDRGKKPPLHVKMGAEKKDGPSQWRNRLPYLRGRGWSVVFRPFFGPSERGEKMTKRITLLIVALLLALSMSFGLAGGAFAAKSTTFEKGVCLTKAGKGGGSGEIKEQHHAQCHSQGSDL